MPRFSIMMMVAMVVVSLTRPERLPEPCEANGEQREADEGSAPLLEKWHQALEASLEPDDCETEEELPRRVPAPPKGAEEGRAHAAPADGEGCEGGKVVRSSERVEATGKEPSPRGRRRARQGPARGGRDRGGDGGHGRGPESGGRHGGEVGGCHAYKGGRCSTRHEGGRQQQTQGSRRR